MGHTPFGHQGERTSDDILSGKIDAGIILVKHEEDKELKQLQQGIDFMTRVASGEVQLEKGPKKEKKHKEKK